MSIRFQAVMLAAAVGVMAGGGAELLSRKVEGLLIWESRAFQRLLVMAGRVKVEFGNPLVVGGSLDLSHSFQKVEKFLPLVVVIAVCDGKAGQMVHFHLRHCSSV